MQMGKVRKKGAKTSSRKQKGWEEGDGPATARDQARPDHPPPEPAVSAPPLQLFSKKLREEAGEQQQQGAESQEQADTASDAPLMLFSRKLRASSASDPPGAEQREARAESAAPGGEPGAPGNPAQPLSSQAGSSGGGSAASRTEYENLLVAILHSHH